MLEPTKQPKMRKIEPGLASIYCGHCGRFLGYEAIIKGVMKIFCAKCKGWTEISNDGSDEVDKDSGL